MCTYSTCTCIYINTNLLIGLSFTCIIHTLTSRTYTYIPLFTMHVFCHLEERLEYVVPEIKKEIIIQQNCSPHIVVLHIQYIHQQGIIHLLIIRQCTLCIICIYMPHTYTHTVLLSQCVTCIYTVHEANLLSAALICVSLNALAPAFCRVGLSVYLVEVGRGGQSEAVRRCFCLNSCLAATTKSHCTAGRSHDVDDDVDCKCIRNSKKSHMVSKMYIEMCAHINVDCNTV